MFVCIIVVIWWLLTSEAEIQQKRVDQLTKEWRPVGNSWVMQGCFMEIHGNPDDSCGELAVTVMVQTNKNFSVHMDLIISFHCWNVNLFSFWLGSVYLKIRSHASTQPFYLIFERSVASPRDILYIYIVSLFNARILNHVVACAATPIFRDAARSWQKSRSNKARPKKNWMKKRHTKTRERA